MQMSIWNVLAPIAMMLPAAAALASGPSAEIACEVGVTPTALAVAGASPADAQAVLQAIGTATAERTALTAARAAVDSAISAVDQARAALDTAPGDPDLAAAYASTVDGLNQAQATVAAARQQLVAAALAGLSADVRGRVQTCVARTGRRVPREFLVSAVSAAQFEALEGAVLSEERGAADLTASESQLLAEVRAEPAVIAARASISSSLAPITAIFASSN